MAICGEDKVNTLAFLKGITQLVGLEKARREANRVGLTNYRRVSCEVLVDGDAPEVGPIILSGTSDVHLCGY
jgi:hypothetical protein